MATRASGTTATPPTTRSPSTPTPVRPWSSSPPAGQPQRLQDVGGIRGEGGPSETPWRSPTAATRAAP